MPNSEKILFLNLLFLGIVFIFDDKDSQETHY